ncbi:MAG TPA: biotin--[acetyl-CoA-carboxylase] ligase [Acidimicrobiales bacterium]|nr:biotin--[acetyl-CoA-carboxylase] ligase [Acidimicrobiales bacterium]
MSAAAVPEAFSSLTGPPGTRFREIRWFEEIDSTNRYLGDCAAAGAAEGLVAAADHQRAGRGRLGRRWEAPPGRNLLVSILLRPSLGPGALHLCTAVVALAAAAACERLAVVTPSLKWPNDLMVGERKLAGVLAETAGVAGAPSAVVVGIGVNVGWPAPDGEPGEAAVPAEIAPIATSLWRESGRRHEPRALLQLLLADLEPRVAALRGAAGRRAQAAEYRRRCATVGRRVRVELHGETVVGEAADVTPEGHLLVDVGACLRTVTAGDVVHLRDGS